MALNDTRLRHLKPTGKRFELADRDGLALRMSQRGVMSWTVAYRIAGAGIEPGARVARVSGPKQRLTLGEYPTLSLADARDKAAYARRLARAGNDPAVLLSAAPKAN